jgi:hypothetical protein
VLVPRDPGDQILSTTKDLTIHVPPHRTVHINGVFTACLQVQQHGPEQGEVYDVSDHLSVVGAAHPVAAQLLALIGVVNARHAWNAGDAQGAIWDVADATPAGARSLPWLSAAGIDPTRLAGGFPDVDNPNAGSTDPRSRFLPGLLSPGVSPTTTLPGASTTTTTTLAGAGATTTTLGGAAAPLCAPTRTLAEARCWVDHLTGLVTEASGLRKALRRKLGGKLRAVRVKLAGADHARPAARAKRLKAARALIVALERSVARSLGRGLLDTDLASALTTSSAAARAAVDHVPSAPAS